MLGGLRNRHLSNLLFLLLLLLRTSCAATSGGQRIPHVDECNFCAKCTVDNAPSPLSANPAPIIAARALTQHLTSEAVASSPAAAAIPASGRDSTVRATSAAPGPQHSAPKHARHASSSLATALRQPAFSQVTGSRRLAVALGQQSQGLREAVVHPGFPAVSGRLGDVTGLAPHETGHTPPLPHRPEPWTLWPASIPRILTGAAIGRKGSLGPRLVASGLVEKSARPNCTLCRGCNADLFSMTSQDVHFSARVKFSHSPGASASWLFYAQPAGTSQRYIVKVLCLPWVKTQSGGPLQFTDRSLAGCTSLTYENRLRSVLAQQQLQEECGAAGLSPKVWLASLSAILPDSGGYHVRWLAVWQEEARGITLEGLAAARADQLAMELLNHRLNRTQVLQMAVLDLLTAQCDRHSQNVFIDQQGRLQAIDNDKALGVVPNCGTDSLVLPGTRYHSILRLDYWGSISKWYRRNANSNGFCRGPIDARSVVDYRCAVPQPPDNTTQLDPAARAAAQATRRWLAKHAAGGSAATNSTTAVQLAGLALGPAGRRRLQVAFPGAYSSAAAGQRLPAVMELGTQYPGALATCIRKLSGMTEQQVALAYGLRDPLALAVLVNRSRDMATRGFEWTLQHGLPQNVGRFNVPVQPACCGLAMDRSYLTCATCWSPLLTAKAGLPGAGII